MWFAEATAFVFVQGGPNVNLSCERCLLKFARFGLCEFTGDRLVLS